jgi:AcrR family transcriptional regulator
MRNLSDHKKNEIIKAAGRVFPKKGFHKTLMDNVANEAGIGKGTIYRYFSNKEDLFFSVLEDATDHLTTGLQSVVDKKNAPDACIVEMMKTMADFMVKSRPLFSLMHEIEGRVIMKRANNIKAHNQKAINLLANQLAKGAKAGIFKKGNYKLWAILIALSSRRVVLSKGIVNKNNIINELTDFIFHGISAM